MCPPPGSAWPGWLGIAAASVSQLVWRHPLAAVAGRAVAPAGRDLRRDLPGHRLDLGPADLGHVVGMGRAADLDAVLFFLYLGYIALASAERERGGEGRIAAIFGLVGAINLPIIHYSVLWWRTLHQGQSIGAHRLDHRQHRSLWPLPLTMIGFTCLFGAAVLMRMRAELAEAKVEARLRRMSA